MKLKMKKKLINEYEAAIKFDLSPTLLRWMAANSIFDKTRITYEERDEVYYYSQDELEHLNKKMEGRWPKTAIGKRPNIPEGIKREIRHEARNSCPACNKSYGEIAHIDPVSATHCNHPKNLIFLCPDHHTEYDNAKIPTNIDRDEILILKAGLKIFQRQIWKAQGKLINSYLAGLNSAKSLLGIHESIRNTIPELEFKEALDNIVASTQAHSTKVINKNKFSNQDFIATEIDSYISNNQENICPLCDGQGKTDFYDPCPVCLGDGELDPTARDNVDLSDYQLVSCRLCSGAGHSNGVDCPACGSEGVVSQYYFDNHDWSMYDLVKCKLCSGSGKYLNDDCPPCGSEGLVSQYFYDHHDWSGYDLVECKLCEGTGKHDGDDCSPCDGEGKISQYFYDNHDWSIYDLVTCKLCDGDGRHAGDYCPACDGTGEVSQGFYDHHDWSRYDTVTCKLCRGSGQHYGEDCIPCNGEGHVSQSFSDYNDWSDYEMVECQLCKGEGRYHANDCSPCNGEGRVSKDFDRRHNWRKYR